MSSDPSPTPVMPARPPDEIRYGDWEPDGEPYPVRANLNEGLFVWPEWVDSTMQAWHRRRMERWHEGDVIIGRWTWEPLR